GEDDRRVPLEKRVHDGVDHRPAPALVPDAEAQIEHQGQPALLREAGRVYHRALHAAVHGDAAACAVGDLETDELRAGGDAVEAGHVEQIVARGDPGHGGAVAAVGEHRVDRGNAGRL